MKKKMNITNFYRFFKILSRFFGYNLKSKQKFLRINTIYVHIPIFKYHSHTNWIFFTSYSKYCLYKKTDLHKINSFFVINSEYKKYSWGGISPCLTTTGVSRPFLLGWGNWRIYISMFYRIIFIFYLPKLFIFKKYFQYKMDDCPIIKM